MPKRDYNYLTKKIQKKTFGILSTVSPKNWSQSSGILFGSLVKDNQIKIYVLTEKNYVKARNMKNNNHVSFLIPFPHYWLRLVPSFTIYFQGITKFLSSSDSDAINSHRRKRILRMSLKELESEKYGEDLIFIEINPYKKIHCYGVGFSFLETVKNPHDLAYSISIP
ncbi:MAG: hypothetical protein ACW967_03570 [Candidatus Hodarchaeales archaeon]